MMHRAWSSIEEVSYCFSRSYIKFQGHTALKIVEFDPNWAFPDCNSSLNSPMAMKCCTKLETAKERCPFVFQGHPSNFKVTRYKTSPILTQIGRFRIIGRSQLSNPSHLPCSNLGTKSSDNPLVYLWVLIQHHKWPICTCTIMKLSSWKCSPKKTTVQPRSSITPDVLLMTFIPSITIDIIFSWGWELHGPITQSAKFDDL